jgi:hypothetical protein
MTKYIDADIFVTHCCNSCIKNGVSCCPTVDSCDYIEDLQAFLVDAPAADVEPVVRGTWEEHPIADTTDEGEQYVAMFWQCSNCHGKLIYWNFQRTKYCPDCGAHMMERSGSGE